MNASSLKTIFAHDAHQKARTEIIKCALAELLRKDFYPEQILISPGMRALLHTDTQTTRTQTHDLHTQKHRVQTPNRTHTQTPTQFAFSQKSMKCLYDEFFFL